jgi:hypothetical protein
VGQSLTILIGAALIAGAIAFTFRWEVTGARDGLVRLDRWTGQVTACQATPEARVEAAAYGKALRLECGGAESN